MVLMHVLSLDCRWPGCQALPRPVGLCALHYSRYSRARHRLLTGRPSSVADPCRCGRAAVLDGMCRVCYTWAAMAGRLGHRRAA